jgi:hypothetical protein
MKQIKNTPEYRRFEEALQTVLRVSHADLKAELEAEKKEKKRRRAKHACASRGSDASR